MGHRAHVWAFSLQCDLSTYVLDVSKIVLLLTEFGRCSIYSTLKKTEAKVLKYIYYGWNDILICLHVTRTDCDWNDRNLTSCGPFSYIVSLVWFGYQDCYILKILVQIKKQVNVSLLYPREQCKLIKNSKILIYTLTEYHFWVHFIELLL